MDTNRHEITEPLGDFETQWIFSKYESGRPVSEIAAEMKISESRVYAKMRVRPKTYEEIKSKEDNKEVKRPRNWGGYILYPDTIEFWQGRPSRLHDRIIYKKEKNKWVKTRLYP